MAEKTLTDTSTTVKIPVTPGPWTCVQGSCDGQPSEWWDVMGPPEPYTAGGPAFARGVCMVYGHDGAAEANARLIAAAPDLIDDARQNDAAFTWLAEQMNSITDNAKHWNVAQLEALAQDLRIGIEHQQKRTRAVIVKAEGGGQ